MPVPRIFVWPVPIVIATVISYQFGLTYTRPEWLQWTIARSYGNSLKEYRNYHASFPAKETTKSEE